MISTPHRSGGPLPEAKDGAAPSPETGWRLVPVIRDGQVQLYDTFDAEGRWHGSRRTLSQCLEQLGHPDALARVVRDAWVKWAQTQSAPKPSWLVPFDGLSEPDKEADRQIGDALFSAIIVLDAAPAAPSPDLAALEELAAELNASAIGWREAAKYAAPPSNAGYTRDLRDWARVLADTAKRIRAAILKAQPNAGPSADGGKGGGG